MNATIISTTKMNNTMLTNSTLLANSTLPAAPPAEDIITEHGGNAYVVGIGIGIVFLVLLCLMVPCVLAQWLARRKEKRSERAQRKKDGQGEQV